MKRFAVLVLTLLLAILLSGCSYGYDFMIVNNSEAVLEIEYRWQGSLASTPYKFRYENFDGKTFSKQEPIDGSFTKEDFESAERDKVFQVSLEPKQALRIFVIYNVEKDKIESKLDESFNINHLKLMGSKGTIEMTGKQVWLQFQQIQDNYFIIYR